MLKDDSWSNVWTNAIRPTFTVVSVSYLERTMTARLWAQSCLTANMMSQSRREEMYAMRLVLVALMVLCGRDGKLIWMYPVCLSGFVDREGPFIPYPCSKT